MCVLDAFGVLPGVQDVINDFVETDSVFDLSKHERAVAAHLPSVSIHYGEICAHSGREVGFVDDEEIALRNSWAAFSRDLVSARDVDYLDGEIGQLATEARGEIIASGLDQ